MQKPDPNAELLRIYEASASFTNEALGRILRACDGILESELPGGAKKSLTYIDSECCRLMRNRLLLGTLFGFMTKNAPEVYCSFTETYENCFAAAGAICLNAGADLGYYAFYESVKLAMPPEHCCILLLAPVALALERDEKAAIKVSASHKDCTVSIKYAFAGSAPPLARLVEEGRGEDTSGGLFFEDTLLARSLAQTVGHYGGMISFTRDSIRITLPAAPLNGKPESEVPRYIDNRFSVPYIMLSKAVRRDI